MGICCFNTNSTRLNFKLCHAEPLQTVACSKQGGDQTVPLSTALLQVLAAAAPCSAAVLRMFAIFNVAPSREKHTYQHHHWTMVCEVLCFREPIGCEK